MYINKMSHPELWKSSQNRRCRVSLPGLGVISARLRPQDRKKGGKRGKTEEI
jgi:hypothetical protein